MRWNAPLSEEHAELLLSRLAVEPRSTVLDLGCGWGELLVRAVAGTGADTQGVGVDSDPELLRRGEALAAERGLADQVRFVCQQAEAWTAPAERVICIGASHAWGEVVDALEPLYHATLPGGRLLFGEGCWERPPTDEAAAIFTNVPPLTELVTRVEDAGWRVVSLTTADQREWDDFESTWRAGRQEWLLANPDDPEAEATRRSLDERLAEYVGVYRGVLGFAYLVLGRP
jgi:cyclopropane fatty-acyl-phospholipid synthase-like methyltransferase